MEFRKSRSIDRVNGLLDSSLELFLHQLDLRYTLLRYVVWVIPTLGFVGTVIGIADAMAFAGSGAVEMENLLSPTTQKLAVAFYTTLVALLQSGVLVFGMNSIQAGEEKAINDAGQYCLENLVMRLMEPGQLEAARSRN
jgi:biopolymer transport protein ExbB/TolQ